MSKHQSIGIEHFSVVGLIFAAIGRGFVGGVSPSNKNLRALIAAADCIRCFDRKCLGSSDSEQRGSLDMLKDYRSILVNALPLKKPDRPSFLSERFVGIVKKYTTEHREQFDADMAKLSKPERATLQSYVDKMVG